MLLLLGSIVMLAACGPKEPANVIATEAVSAEETERVVTRVVLQTIPVTVTPNSEVPQVRYEPVVLDISFISDRLDIDPQKSIDADGIDIVENIFVSLTNYNHQTNSIEPELASSWDVSDDGRIWTFQLRQDIHWVKPTASGPNDDGLWDVESVRPVVAADVVSAVQRACLRETEAPDAFVLYLIQGCKELHETIDAQASDVRAIGARALDEFTLQFTLTKPGSQFLTLTSMPIFHPVPAELTDEFGDNWQDAESLITSGPFFVVPGSIQASKPELHRNSLWPISRRGNVDVVKIGIYSEGMYAYQLWQAKKIDVSPMPDLPAADLAEIIENSPEKAMFVPEQTVFYLGFNFDSGVFREPEVRQALSAAIDRRRFVDEIYGDWALPMRHLTPPGVLGAPPADEVGKGYDPDFARQRMADSGFRSCRLMPSFTFLVSTSDLSLRQAELIRQMWVEELGCSEDQIIIEQVQFGTLLANTRQDANRLRPAMWELGWASYYPDSHNWVGDLLHCTESENRQDRPCSEVDELILQAVGESDLAQRQSMYRQVENLFFGGDGITPLIPLYASGDYILVQTWVSFVPALFGGEQYETYTVQADLKRLEQSR